MSNAFEKSMSKRTASLFSLNELPEFILCAEQ